MTLHRRRIHLISGLAVLADLGSHGVAPASLSEEFALSDDGGLGGEELPPRRVNTASYLLLKRRPD